MTNGSILASAMNDHVNEHFDKTTKWDIKYLLTAKYWAELNSKDPSTKVGAVIVGKNGKIISLSYNGFPRGVVDREDRYLDRETKYGFVSHAERNAMDDAETSIEGLTLYVTLPPCNECAKSIIQKGLKKVVWIKPIGEQAKRWGQNLLAQQMFLEAKVAFDEIEIPVEVIDAIEYLVGNWRMALDHWDQP